MAWAGTLTYGSTTINIWNGTSGIQMAEAYLPQAGPDFSEFGTVTEDIEFIITGSTKADIEVHMRELNRAFMNARLRQERNVGDQVYFNLTPDGYSAAWRSELLDAIIQPGLITGIWGRFTLKVVGSWTRRNWWEGPQADVPLTNGNDTDDTTGLKVYYCNDGTGAAGSIHHNYATIDGVNDISGDLPGFGILSAVFAQTCTKLYTQYGPSADMPVHWFDLSGSADATASGGEYLSTAVSSGVASYATSYQANVVNNVGPTGAPCRILARIGGFTATRAPYRIRPRVSTKLGTVEYLNTLYQNLYTSFDIYQLGVSPVGIYSIPDAAPTQRNIYFGLDVYAASGNLYQDFIQIAPAQTVRDYNIASLAAPTLSDDTTTDTNYYTYNYSSITFYGNPSPTGSNKILLYPGVEQKFYMIGDPWGRDYYATVTLKYRPRRSTL